MNSEGFAVILPEAPYAIDGYRGGFEYWPTGPGSTQKIDGEILQEHARFDVSTMYLDVLKDAAVYAPLDLDRVVVSGFSMGATTSYSVVQQAPEAVIGAAIFAGMIRPGMNDSSLFTAFKEKGGKILIMHGEEDRPAFAKRAEALVREAGVDVQFKLYPETGHTVTDAMIEDFVVWVHGVVGQ